MAEHCFACGANAVSERIAPATRMLAGREVTVRNDRHMVCASCGEARYDGAQISESERAFARALREAEGLLAPDALRRIRRSFGLTQAEMERLLATGPKTWVRWERGTVVQSRIADQFIRQLAQRPDLVGDLLQRADVQNPRARAILDAIGARVVDRLAQHLQTTLAIVPTTSICAAIAEAAVRALPALAQEAIEHAALDAEAA